MGGSRAELAAAERAWDEALEEAWDESYLIRPQVDALQKLNPYRATPDE